jgi:hypothetical protein
MVVFKNPGSVPENWRAVTEEDNMEAGSSMASSHHVEPETFASSDGLERKRVGYCSQCQNGKPPRCHHCSICKPTCFLMWLMCFYYACIFSIYCFFSPALSEDFVGLTLFIFLGKIIVYFSNCFIPLHLLASPLRDFAIALCSNAVYSKMRITSRFCNSFYL